MGVYPIKWGTSYIILIHKSGNNHEIFNYRPISIINGFAKLFDMTVYEKISPNIRRNIISEQYGSMTNRFIVSNL